MADKPATRRDSLDFRDRLYEPALIPVAPQLLPDKRCIFIRDQGMEGTCTGFGLAAVIDYINRMQGIRKTVSARMLYEMAKRHDHWPGDDYEGSSARGAMKGWHKSGVCTERDWPYDPDAPGHLTVERQQAALRFPLGAYYRVLPRRADLHTALNETGAVYAAAQTHTGWDMKHARGGVIAYKKGWKCENGHAFAIVGYTPDGFIIQNSWGKGWGGLKIGKTRYEGCALWTYEDVEDNLWDAWVARLALPVQDARSLDRGGYVNVGGQSKPRTQAPPRHEIADHYVHIDDGQFDPFGDYPSKAAEVDGIVRRAAGTDGGTPPRHLLLYAHGGLNDVKACAARVGAWRPVFRANKVHDIHFIWETGLFPELRDVLLGKQDFAKERAGGLSDWWDKVVERATHPLGHALWKEMQSDADHAFRADAAGTRTLERLFAALAEVPENRRPRLHLVGHSAGSIWFAHLLERWRALGGPAIDNLILFAPACTAALFNSHIRPALKDRTVGHLHHFLLDDKTEQDDNVAQIYRKSLLYLVSRSYERRDAVVPLMGMAKHLGELDCEGIASRVRHYDTAAHREKTTAASHGGFDNDAPTMNSMLRLVLGGDTTHPFEAKHLKGY